MTGAAPEPEDRDARLAHLQLLISETGTVPAWPGRDGHLDGA